MNTNCLVFTHQQLNAAREHRAEAPYADAWRAFESLQPTAGSIEQLIYAALRWSLLDDADAAARALAALETREPVPATTAVDDLQQLFAHAQALACLDTYAPYQAVKPRLVNVWHEQVAALPGDVAPHERAWLALLTLCDGILRDDGQQREAAAQQIRTLANSITAHGYIAGVVEGGNGGLERTIQAVQALCLAAEAASLVGIDLWGYEQRGVSIMTAAVYPLYYYFYPEKWPWDSAIPFDPAHPPKRSRRNRQAVVEPEPDLEPTKALFRQHASFLEIIHRRAAGKIHAVTLMLNDLRPIIDLLGGGAVTLTHALPPAPKRRGLFGRAI